MKLTIEELRKVYDESYEGAIVAQDSNRDFDAAIDAAIAQKEGK